MNYISRHQFCPDYLIFKELSPKEYQTVRSNPDNPVKNRSEMTRLDLIVTTSEIRFTRNAAREANMRSYILDGSRTVKIIGFNTNNSSVASTGTSQLNTLCFTNGMGPCIAVAIGGENIQNGVPSQGAKARIFHVFAFDDNKAEFLQDIRKYVEKIQSQGLTVKVAMHGGEEISVEDSENLRALFSSLSIEPEFDETCEKRGDKDTLLGVVIEDDNTVRFVTELAMISNESDSKSELSDTQSINRDNTSQNPPGIALKKRKAEGDVDLSSDDESTRPTKKVLS